MAKDFLSQNNSSWITSLRLHTDGTMTIRISKNGTVKLVLYNAKGMVIYKSPAVYVHKGKTTLIKLKRPAKGLYYISVEMNGQRKALQKIITM